jgi:hypothetical protein
MEILLLIDRQVAILLPFVLEVVFNIDHNGMVNWFVRVEHSNEAKELCEIITVAKRCLDVSHFVDVFNEVAHDI